MPDQSKRVYPGRRSLPWEWTHR